MAKPQRYPDEVPEDVANQESVQEEEISASSTPQELRVPKNTPRSNIGNKTPELSQAGCERLAAFLEKAFGQMSPSTNGESGLDDSSPLTELVDHELSVRVKRHQVSMEEVEDEHFSRR